MGVFDQAARFASQADPDAVAGRLLAGTKAALRFKEWADSRMQKGDAKGDSPRCKLPLVQFASGAVPFSFPPFRSLSPFHSSSTFSRVAGVSRAGLEIRPT